MKKTTLLLIFCCLSMLIKAQIPVTSIYLMDVELNVNTGEYSFNHRGKIHEWKGYNNQPSFTPTGDGIYFSCIKEDKQADIYYFDFITNTTTQVTHTPKWKEYSPQLMPDGKHLSVVRVEEDDSTQHLWQYNLDGTPDKIICNASPVGYYCCFDSSNYALFMVNKEAGDLYITTPTNQPKKILANIGRCLIPLKNNCKEHAFTYVNKTMQADSTYQLTTMDAKANKLSTYEVPLGCEDYCVGMNEHIWYGKDGILYELNNGKSTAIADFNATKLEFFYRLTYFPINQTEGRLAVVTYVGKKP